ncbi:MAG: PIN domain-containing protein [Chloroflexota bacterium]|nr:MAG: hypothetical protein DIU68_05610 [Chloroflexota bacterium]
MKVVLDTNIFVAAGFNARSHSAAILTAIRNGNLTLVWNAEVRAETRAILNRIPKLSWAVVADLFAPEGEYGGPTCPECYGQIVDPDDRKFAALAAATGATLVSNDVHLLAVRDRLDVPVRTPREVIFTDQGRLSSRA